MTDQEKLQVKERILKKIERTKSDIEYLTELTKPIAPENAIGRISRMDAINNKSINEAALRQAKNKMVTLQQSLKDFDKPGFGICKQCGSDIEMGRLMIMPEGKKCMSCLKK